MSRVKLAIIGLVLLGLIGAGFLIFLWYQSRAGQGLSLEIAAPEQIKLGVPFELQVNINNSSKTVLQDSRLTLELPAGVLFLGQAASKNFESKTLGNLGIGSFTQERFKLMATEGPQTIKQIKASLSYLPTALGARFEKSQVFDLAVGEAGLHIDLILPAKVFSGEDFEMAIAYRNEADIDYADLILTVDYPSTFTFLKSTLKPNVGNREWRLGDLRPSSANEFKITGNLVGPDNAFFDFKAVISAVFMGQVYRISDKTATISINPSPLSLKIDLNESADYIVNPGDPLTYTFVYGNNTDVGLRDVVLKAKLTGEMFDFAELSTNASYRSLDNTLTWNAANTPELALLQPGASGAVQAKLKVRPHYPIRRLGDKNFILKVQAEIESPTVPYFVAAQKTVGLAKLETKVAGRTVIDAKGFFRDAAAGVVNSGPFPPRVGQATQFTIHWLITNYATDVSGVEVKAFLGPNVRFTGLAKSNIGTVPVYNERTQEVVWQIDKIAATKGVIGSQIEAIFQVEAVPSQAGTYWPLMRQTFLKATDDFTGRVLESSDFEITTALSDDLTVGSQQGIVIQ